MSTLFFFFLLQIVETVFIPIHSWETSLRVQHCFCANSVKKVPRAFATCVNCWAQFSPIGRVAKNVCLLLLLREPRFYYCRIILFQLRCNYTRIYLYCIYLLAKSWCVEKLHVDQSCGETIAGTFVYGERLRTSVGYLRARFHCGRNIATWAQTRNSNE